jgi:D-inositol-3-phosphate glycosyltransferase
VLLFVGRIQPLKGADLAVRALADVTDRRAQLIVVGGPSGPDGPAELAALRALEDDLGLEHRVQFVAPQPHGELADYYRAADVCIVPSRTESFGLVALEAAACGTPVVAASVGGLRRMVDDGVTGYLVDERDPSVYAALVDRVLRDDRDEMRARAVARSTRYRWSIAAARLRRHYDDLTARATVKCS